MIASGRAAMESLACGRPTIAVASRGTWGSSALTTSNSPVEPISEALPPSAPYIDPALLGRMEAVRHLSTADLRSAREMLLAIHGSARVASLHRALVARLTGKVLDKGPGA